MAQNPLAACVETRSDHPVNSLHQKELCAFEVSSQQARRRFALWPGSGEGLVLGWILLITWRRRRFHDKCLWDLALLPLESSEMLTLTFRQVLAHWMKR